MRNQSKHTSILLLDDNADLARYYKLSLAKFPRLNVTIETDSNRAKFLAERQLFDIVVIDAKLDYRGYEYGGLRLADDLRPRYGANSILVFSRFITSTYTQAIQLGYEFLEKYSNSRSKVFENDLYRKISVMRNRQYVFVAMPFSHSYDSVFRQIRSGIKNAGFQCIRVDKLLHTRPIQNVIFESVEKSKLVVFMADGANANAYYEAGFADAMRKEVLIIAESTDVLKFDVRNRQTIIYGRTHKTLSKELENKIISLRHSKPISL